MIFTEKVHRVYYEMYWASSSYPDHTCSKHPLPIDSVCHFALFSVGHCFVYTSIYCFWFGIFKLFLYQAASSQWFSSLELNDFLASRKREQERKARGNNILASWLLEKQGWIFLKEGIMNLRLLLLHVWLW